jgi:DNA-binding transcriptional ArsR family regulator
LRDREVSVGELAQRTGLRMSNASQHLAMMRDRGVLTSRRQGVVIYYRVTNPRMREAFDILREVLFEQIEADGSLLRQRPRGRRRTS